MANTTGETQNCEVRIIKTKSVLRDDASAPQEKVTIKELQVQLGKEIGSSSVTLYKASGTKALLTKQIPAAATAMSAGAVELYKETGTKTIITKEIQEASKIAAESAVQSYKDTGLKKATVKSTKAVKKFFKGW